MKFVPLVGLFVSGIVVFLLGYTDPGEKWYGYVTMAASGIAVLFAGVSIARSAQRHLKARLEAQIQAEAEKRSLEAIAQHDFRNVEQTLRLRDQKARHDFEKNLGAQIVIQRFQAARVLLFPGIEWELRPGMNILLGRNGYGKSLILRALAATLQQDEDTLRILMPEDSRGSKPFLEVAFTCNGKPVATRRGPLDFVRSGGKVPLLAIPEARFFDRSQNVVGPAPEDAGTIDLKTRGAEHFLLQKPYGSIIQSLLYEICLDFWDHDKSFDLPVFSFLQECVKRLTDYEFKFASIERQGRTGFEIRVLTEGNQQPIPIQHASQGTLSVLAMCGLIRSYVRSLSPESDGLVQRGSAIVLIDEADAHLHPAWQQKFPTLLRDLFPNVQFILSAHSPLFVAGCWRGEVAVLRRTERKRNTTPQPGFRVEQLDQDFVGATPEELYRKVFEIEELDDTYLEYATKATRQTGADARINQLVELQEKTTLSPAQQDELNRLEEESRRMSRAQEVNQERKEKTNLALKVEQLEAKILELQRGEKAEGSKK